MPESVVIRPLDKTKTIIRSQDLKPIKNNSIEMVENICLLVDFIISLAYPEIQIGKRTEWAKINTEYNF